MGAMDRMANKGKAKPKEGGDSRLAYFSRRREAIDFDWRVFGSTLFAAALGALASSGAAIMVGGASGGRGAVVSIYLDGDKHRTYLDDGEQFTEWCHDVIATFGSTSEDTYAVYGLEKPQEK